MHIHNQSSSKEHKERQRNLWSSRMSPTWNKPVNEMLRIYIKMKRFRNRDMWAKSVLFFNIRYNVSIPGINKDGSLIIISFSSLLEANKTHFSWLMIKLFPAQHMPGARTDGVGWAVMSWPLRINSQRPHSLKGRTTDMERDTFMATGWVQLLLCPSFFLFWTLTREYVFIDF